MDLYIQVHACGCSARVGTAFVGGTVSTWEKMTDTRKQKAEKASEMPIKHSLFVENMQIGIAGFPQLVV